MLNVIAGDFILEAEPLGGSWPPNPLQCVDISHMALSQNLIALVKIKIAGIFGCELPTNIDNNRLNNLGKPNEQCLIMATIWLLYD